MKKRLTRLLVICVCLIVVLLMVTFELTISRLIQMWREREHLDYSEVTTRTASTSNPLPK